MSNELGVRKLDPTEYDQWDAFVDQTPQGMVFNKSFWLQAHADVLGADMAVYGCYRKDQLVAGCALYFKTLAALRIITTPPGTPYMGILIQPRQTNDSARRLRHNLDVTAHLAAAIKSDFDRALLINHPGLIDVRPFLWQKWSVNVLYTFIVDLNTVIDAPPKVRSKLRKAQRLGIEVRPSNDIDAFHDIWAKTFYKQNSVPRFSREALAKIFSRLRAHHCCRLYLAFDGDDQSISGRVVVWSGRKASAWLLGTNPAYLSTGVTPLLFWHTFQDLKGEFDTFDMFGSNIESIARFKSEFGGELTPYYAAETFRSAVMKYVTTVRWSLGILQKFKR
jgi:hypothetical protein